MKNAVIFGAGSTIALKIANLLAQNGYNLILLSRNLECLELDVQNLQVMHQNVKINKLHYDAAAEVDMQGILLKITEIVPSIDLLLVAHGTLPEQELCQSSWVEEYSCLKINGLSVIQICHYFANFMSEKKHGTIAVISSVAGEKGRQSNYSYGTAKGMLNIYLQGLRNRLYKDNVHVLTILPGFVATKMTASFKKGTLWATADKVAKDIVNACLKKKNILYTPYFWRYIMLIVKTIPESIFKKMKL